MTDGPAAEMVLPEPMNRPVPMAPPMAISWMCLLLSCRSRWGGWPGVVMVLVLTCCSLNKCWLECRRGRRGAHFIGDRIEVVEGVKMDSCDAGLAVEPGHQGVG